MKTLLIIDPQKDFISGSLSISGATESMNRLQTLIPFLQNLQHIMVSLDTHPYNHCSFIENGGIWNSHCIQYTTGGAIEEGIMQTLLEEAKTKGVQLHFLEKGKNKDMEEYSAFECVTPTINNILKLSDELFISGIAGDICVYQTILSLISMGFREQLTLITDTIVNINGGEKLEELCRVKQLRTTTTEKLIKQ